MKKADIDCYRTNYDKAGWLKYANGSFVTMPVGVLDAIKTLCDEVERLSRAAEKKELAARQKPGDAKEE